MNVNFQLLSHTILIKSVKYPHNIPSPSLVSSSCQNADVNPANRVIELQRTRQTDRPIFRLTTGWPASTPRGIADIVKTSVNAGPARNSYSIPVAVYSHTHGTDTLEQHLHRNKIWNGSFSVEVHCCMLIELHLNCTFMIYKVVSCTILCWFCSLWFVLDIDASSFARYVWVVRLRQCCKIVETAHSTKIQVSRDASSCDTQDKTIELVQEIHQHQYQQNDEWIQPRADETRPHRSPSTRTKHRGAAVLG